MVRFIIHEINVYKTRNNIIYIPIWLDLLSSLPKQSLGTQQDLHSNMVRFIIDCPISL